MGKSKNRERSEVEYLKGEVRRLRKLLRQFEKSKHIYEAIDLHDPETIELPKVDKCSDCGKGEIKLILNFGNRMIYECSLCNYRRTEKVTSNDDGKA